MISASFSQVGFGAIYFGFLYSSLAVFVGVVFVESEFVDVDFEYTLFRAFIDLAGLSPESSQVRVETRGAADLSHVDPAHL